ncbi:MAG: cytochrome c [Sulfurimonas sp.]|jgi:cytochrome c
MKILLSIVLALLLVGCSEDTNKVEKTKILKDGTKVTVVVEKAKLSPKYLFKKCASCHGKNADQAALGKSQIIQGWSQEKLEKALHGYKDGSYGGDLKNVMKSQVKKLSDEDIEDLSEYISDL